MKKFCIVIILLFLSISITYAGRYHGNRRSKKFLPEEEYHKVVKEEVVVVLPAPLGPKKLIAVTEFENKTSLAGQANLGTGMADQLITALVNTGRFIVLERQSLDSVFHEQNIGTSVRGAKEGGAKIGDITRAQILIQGAITEFEQSESIAAGGVSSGKVTAQASEATAHVAVDVRVYDTTTGQILASQACKGTAIAGGSQVGYSGKDVKFGAAKEARTPLDFAVREAITDAVNFITLELQKVPWEGRIAEVTDIDIFINCGRTTGIMPGDQFSVFKPGKPIIDPETGLNLGSEYKLFGKVEVIQVEEKFSKVIPVNGKGFERNDVIKYEGPKPFPMPTQSTVK